MPERTVEIVAEIKAITKKAFLLSDDGKSEQWVPRSHLTHSDQPFVGDTIVFELPEWLAIDKEFV